MMLKNKKSTLKVRASLKIPNHPHISIPELEPHLLNDVGQAHRPVNTDVNRPCGLLLRPNGHVFMRVIFLHVLSKKTQTRISL